MNDRGGPAVGWIRGDELVDAGEREALKALVEGRDLGTEWALMGTGTEDRASDALSGDVPKTRKAPR
jgi:hypothetical protein